MSIIIGLIGFKFPAQKRSKTGVCKDRALEREKIMSLTKPIMRDGDPSGLGAGFRISNRKRR